MNAKRSILPIFIAVFFATSYCFCADDTTEQKFTGDPLLDRVKKIVEYIVNKGKKEKSRETVYQWGKNRKSFVAVAEGLDKAYKSKTSYRQFKNKQYLPVLSEYQNNTNGSKSRTDYTYNKKGLLTKRETNGVDAKGENYTTVMINEYDKKDNLVLSKDKRRSGLTEVNSYTYSKEGDYDKITKQNKTGGKGWVENNMKWVTLIKHNKKKQVLEEKYKAYDSDKEIDSRTTTFEYNENGRLIKTQYNQSNQGYFLQSTVTYKYDSNGRLTENHLKEFEETEDEDDGKKTQSDFETLTTYHYK